VLLHDIYLFGISNVTISGLNLLEYNHWRSRLADIELKKTVFAALIFLTLQISGAYLIDKAYADCSSKPVPGVNWESCRKRNLVLSGSDLRNGNFRQTNFASTDMRTSKIDGADFSKAALIRVVFDDSSAEQTNFEKAIGYRASFRNSNLSGAIFRKSELVRADFSGSVLTGADFSKSVVGRTLFNEAIMANNDFSFANIARADFRKAVVTGTITFEGAFSFQTRFEGVDLTKSTGLRQWQIDMACGDKKTLLPGGLRKPDQWPCHIR
jgi:uncharacterized protein YjbI with pentapeptide repeats